MSLSKEKRTNSLDLLLQTDSNPQKDTDKTPRVLEFQKVILKKTSNLPPNELVNSPLKEEARSATITRSKDASVGFGSGELSARVVSVKNLDISGIDEQFQGIKLKATKKPDDFDGSVTTLDSIGKGEMGTPKPTLNTASSPYAAVRLKTVKSETSPTKSPPTSATTEAISSPYAAVRLKTVKNDESPVKSQPTSSTTEAASPFSVVLKSTKKPQDYQESVQKPQFKTNFEKNLEKEQYSKPIEKDSRPAPKSPAKVIKLKDANTVTVTNSVFTPPKLKTADTVNPFIPTSSVLYLLKGHRKIYLTPTTSISESDSYVYVDIQKLVIYVWNGKSAGAVKKVKSRDYGMRLEREYRGSLKMVIIERGSTIDTEFMEKFGMEDKGDDDAWETEFEGEIKLVKFPDEEVVGEKRISTTILDSNYVYGMEARDGVYIWNGSLSLAQMRDDAKAWADRVKGNRKVHIQGAQECMLLFRDKFTDWSEGMSIAVTQTKNIGPADRTWANYHRAQNVGMVKAVDIQRMWLGPEEIASAIVRPGTPVYDKGTRELQGWKCYETYSTKLEDHELNGVLNAGESYTFKVGYEEEGRVGTNIYYWMGSESNSNMKGHAALLANELDPRRVIKQARIVQGAESNSFIDIFGESQTIMVVKKNAAEGVRLFQIQETVSKRIRIQEQTGGINIHSCASFLVLDGEYAAIWKARLSSSELLSKVSNFVSKNLQLKKVEIVEEGSEPSSFWSKLGITAEQVFTPSYYDQIKSLPIKTRLFRISSIKLGNATADEIETPLHQSSFLANGVFILDAYYELFVWLGNEICQSKESKHELIKLALETALDYTDVVKEQESRLDKSNVYLLRQGQEPPNFKSLFLDWKDWSTADGYYQALPRSFSFILNGMKVTDCLNDMSTKKWGLYDLQQMLAQRIPIGLDPKKLQNYLVDREFEEYIGMERSAFEALPEWRKLAMRKKIGLV